MQKFKTQKMHNIGSSKLLLLQQRDKRDISRLLLKDLEDHVDDSVRVQIKVS